MGALIRAYDWSASNLGAPAEWPQSLRTSVGTVLGSKFPSCLVWGSKLTTIYNDAFRPILGNKPEALGRSFRDIWSEAWSEIGPIAERAFAGEPTFIEDFSLTIERNGYPEQSYFTFCYSPVRDETGRVAGFLDTVIETTGKVTAERDLRELNSTLESRVAEAVAQRALFASFVDSTEAAVMACDLDFNILAINASNVAQIESVYGVRPKVGDNLLGVLGNLPHHRAQVEQHWGRALNGEEFSFTQEFGDPRRERRHYEVRFQTLRDQTGSRIGAFQSANDITDRVKALGELASAQEALRQAQKMDAMGQLTGGVAHDVNNLLSPVVGALDLLQRNAVGGEREQRLISGAIASAERIRVLVQRLLAFARRQPLQTQPVDVASLVNGCCQSKANSSLQAGVRSLRGQA